jgi:hypothetical protein
MDKLLFLLVGLVIGIVSILIIMKLRKKGNIVIDNEKSVYIRSNDFGKAKLNFDSEQQRDRLFKKISKVGKLTFYDNLDEDKKVILTLN